MDENVRKEMETLKGMVLAWKKRYADMASEEGGDDYLADDLSEELDNVVYPYLRRLFECDYITGEHVKEFMDFCSEQVQDLRTTLREEARHA